MTTLSGEAGHFHFVTGGGRREWQARGFAVLTGSHQNVGEITGVLADVSTGACGSRQGEAAGDGIQDLPILRAHSGS